MSVLFSRAPIRAAKAFYKGELQWKYPLRRHHFALLRRFVRNTISDPQFYRFAAGHVVDTVAAGCDPINQSL